MWRILCLSQKKRLKVGAGLHLILLPWAPSSSCHRIKGRNPSPVLTPLTTLREGTNRSERTTKRNPAKKHIENGNQGRLQKTAFVTLKEDRMVFFVVVVVVLSLATALPMEKGENEVNQFVEIGKGDEGRVVKVEVVEGELRPLEMNPVATRRKRYFEEFFHKKTQEERRQRMEELKQRNLSQQRRRAQRREQRRQRKQARRENRKAAAAGRRSSTKTGRKPRDLPRIDCRVRSPAHVVNLLLLIHSQKVRDVVAGRWLEECANKPRPRPSTSIRYFG